MGALKKRARTKYEGSVQRAPTGQRKNWKREIKD